MRIVYIGTPDFAVASLQGLIEAGKEVVAVITAPDKPAGRKQQLKASPVKEFAVKAGLPVLQPKNLKDQSFLKELESFQADLQIVVAFRMLPKEVWDMPPLGTFNLHASLLPDYRGAAPINHAIINGEQKTGITTFFLKHEIDTGNVLLQKEVEIEPEENAGSLHDKLMLQGADLVVETVGMIENGHYTTTSQKELSVGKHLNEAPKIFKPFCKIDWSSGVEAIHNKVRGLSPYPCAYAEVLVGREANSLKIYKTSFEYDQGSMKPRMVREGKKRLGIQVSDGILWLEEVQLQGKKRMDIVSLLNGLKEDVQIIFNA